jgi:lipid II:glycine glycyltransferase (peptidoglycan interpeptide bridge formation enzyme)
MMTMIIKLKEKVTMKEAMEVSQVLAVLMRKIKKKQMKMHLEWMKRMMDSEKRISKISKKMQKVEQSSIVHIQKKGIPICKEELRELQEVSELIIIIICRDQVTLILIHSLLIILMQVDQPAVLFK